MSTHTSAEHVLTARNISHSVLLPGRERLQVLNEVSLTVRQGEKLAIVGRSGSGKTTLLSILGLLTSPEHGELTINGRNTKTLSDRQRAFLRNEHLGFVFQSPSLIKHLSAQRNIALPFGYGLRSSRTNARQQVKRALNDVGLQHRVRSWPRQLSGGEQQRVAIARALVRRPTLLLADEPTGALDTATAGSVLDVLIDTSTTWGTALIVVTHDPTVAARMDRTATMDAGRLVWVSP